MTQNEVIQKFIIETTLINPIEKIIADLKSGKMRDCDIKFMDAKLEDLTRVAIKIIGYGSFVDKNQSPEILNEYNTNQYILYFDTLLKLFKSI